MMFFCPLHCVGCYIYFDVSEERAVSDAEVIGKGKCVDYV